jgi:hypothetical protein
MITNDTYLMQRKLLYNADNVYALIRYITNVVLVINVMILNCSFLYANKRITFVKSNCYK